MAVVLAAALAAVGAAGATDQGGAAPAGPADAPAAAGAPRPLSPDDIILDLSPAAEVVFLWLEPTDANRVRARAIATELPYRTLRDYLSSIMNCVATDAEIERAIAVPDSGVCGFGLEPAYRERAALDSLVRALVLRSDSLRARVARDAGTYVTNAPWRPIRVYFVISTRYLFDAVTLDRSLDNSGPVIVFNLSEALGYGESTAERAAIVERVLAHESFHAALRQIEFDRPAWNRYHAPANAFDYITRVMLDEGVAHYVDWKGRAGSDTLFAAKVGGREKKAFDQLALACRRIRDPRTDPDSRAEILGLAATGPIWSKYGAISGMFAAWRIERALGRDSLRALVERGPREFLKSYAAVAAADTTLKRLPKELE
ncbi:MAG TPA: DUF5700 domain-containing putative Zn-dependent protease [Candidatus Eisenbacteria bacterium]|nr:DUF5700 domain-containing putative Zn-dependent protease [Candidatus Eisenbacteria bacterium]